MKSATLRASGLLLALLPACSDGAAADKAAIAAFERFQAALFARDHAALRSLVTAESRDAIAGLPLARLAGQQPLLAAGCRRQGSEHWITVADPNRQGRRSVFVVVREDGRLLVDLLATATHHADYVPAKGPPVLEPRQLTPADLDRARQLQPAAPR